MTLFFNCGVKSDFTEIQAKLQEIDGVKIVAKIPGAKGAEEGMVEVDSQEAGEACVETIRSLGGEYMAQPSNSAEGSGGEGAAKRAPKKEKEDTTTKSFFDNFATLKETRQRQKNDDLREYEKMVREKGGNSSKSKDNKGRGRNSHDADTRNKKSNVADRKDGSRSRSGGRGGRGSNNRTNSRGSTGRGSGRGGRGGRWSNAPRYIQGHVASINNVPESMTNDQIAAVFDSCGTIYDISRYEGLAMVFFDTQDSVLNAIMHVNGTKKMNGNLATVSDGGTLRVPIPQNLNPQALSPQFIHMHQQGMMPPLHSTGGAAPGGYHPGHPQAQQTQAVQAK